MADKDEKGSSPLPNVFFDDLEMYSPRDIKEFGYQLAKGMSYRLYSGAEIRDRIKDGTIIKKRPSKAKKAVKEVVPPQAIPALAPDPPLTDEEREAALEKNDRVNAPREIEHAISRWHVMPETYLDRRNKRKKWVVKESPLTKEDKERIRWLFQKFAFTVEWNEKWSNIEVVVHDKVHTTPVPPRVPTALQRKIMAVRDRLIKKET